eukprot:1696513-Rhodomonas_salina.2
MTQAATCTHLAVARELDRVRPEPARDRDDHVDVLALTARAREPAPADLRARRFEHRDRHVTAAAASRERTCPFLVFRLLLLLLGHALLSMLWPLLLLELLVELHAALRAARADQRVVPGAGRRHQQRVFVLVRVEAPQIPACTERVCVSVRSKFAVRRTAAVASAR